MAKSRENAERENMIRGKHYKPSEKENPRTEVTKARIFRGVVTGQSPDASHLGDFTRLLGRFEMKHPDGRVLAADEAILPKRATRALVARLEAAQAKSETGEARVPFTLHVWTVPAKDNGQGYEYRAEDPKATEIELPEWD